MSKIKLTTNHGDITLELNAEKAPKTVANFVAYVEAGHYNGTIFHAMARTNDPHSATAQFFVNTVDNDFLDFKSPSGQGWGYCVFGEVVEGLDVVDKIRAVKTGNKGFHQDVPAEDVIIEKAEIV